jgi:hypothetical protein
LVLRIYGQYQQYRETTMFRSLALWMLGIPIPIIILIWLFT